MSHSSICQMIHIWCNESDLYLMRHMHINATHCNIRQYLVLHMFDLVNQFAELALIVDWSSTFSLYANTIRACELRDGRGAVRSGAALLLFISVRRRVSTGAIKDRTTIQITNLMILNIRSTLLKRLVLEINSDRQCIITKSKGPVFFQHKHNKS